MAVIFQGMHFERQEVEGPWLRAKLHVMDLGESVWIPSTGLILPAVTQQQWGKGIFKVYKDLICLGTTTQREEGLLPPPQQSSFCPCTCCVVSPAVWKASWVQGTHTQHTKICYMYSGPLWQNTCCACQRIVFRTAIAQNKAVSNIQMECDWVPSASSVPWRVMFRGR